MMTALTSCPRSSDAQPSSSDAQALFTEGRAAMEKGDFSSACARFNESLKLSERASTLLNLAQCEEHQGHLVSAKDHWKRGIAELPPGDERAAISDERVRSLEKRMPHLNVKLASTLPAEARVSVDGGPGLPPTNVGNREVDPGHHTVTLTIPDMPDHTMTVEVAENETNTVTLSLTGVVASSDRRAGSSVGGMSPTRVAGVAVGIVGVVGFGVAAVTGGVLVAKNADIQRECPQRTCTPAGRQAIDSTSTLKAVNAVGWAVGIAGVASGIVMIAVGRDRAGGRSDVRTSLTVLPLAGGAGAAFAGAF